jgi:hypothetical protein
MANSDEGDEKLTLSAILSTLPPQFPHLSLLTTLLIPLTTPYKETRDHHVLITSNNTKPTSQLIHNVDLCPL